MKKARIPLVVTVNGKATLVVQDVESYQAMLERLEQADAVEGIRRGLGQMERGEGRPADEVFANFRAKYDIPNE